jgi:two-component system response regulator (stage 0 sporulation protein F)
MQGRTALVLLAEDDDDMRTMVAEALRREGHRVVEVASGADLLIRIARQYRHIDPLERPDLIITDVRMPVLTGLEVVRGLRDADTNTPVIVMTAFGDPETRREATSLGAVMLDKPLQLADLVSEARRLIDALG